MIEYKSSAYNLRMVKEVNNIHFLKTKIQDSKDAYNYVRRFYHDDIEIYESVFALYLNRANNTTSYVKISQGGIAGTIIDIKIILKYAIEDLASGIVIVHNHPSGNLSPSKADIDICNRLKDAAKLMDIEIIDNLIITKDGYYSFADEEIL